MVPTPESICPYDFWLTESTFEASVELTCLMPTGIVLFLPTSQNATLEEIKQVLFICVYN